MSNEHPAPSPQQPPGGPGPYGPPPAQQQPHPGHPAPAAPPARSAGPAYPSSSAPAYGGPSPYLAQPAAQPPYPAQPGAPSPYATPGAQPPYGQPTTPPPYGQPSAPAPYGQPTALPPYGQPGAQPYGQPHGWPGAAPRPGYAVPAGMPGPVRAAQVVIFATFAIAVLLTVLVAAGSGAEEAGRVFGTYLMVAVLFVLAFRFPRAGNGVRVASIVLASLQILLALGGAARGVPLGILPLAAGVAVLVLLCQNSAKQWFGRDSANGVPPQYS
ncbi:hypothetical protein FB570_106122 [Streptomyces sp. T12]|uniref:hypothetical protein n=1 Tax=Streptomyces sp. T12 TaxID=477697 RepID=UPI0011ACFAA8|nr:hypothetical protein [Streptomyces sp. T12]TWD21414.1 hypothetical protein FB570_106122 [Streptomyces sp. T12]